MKAKAQAHITENCSRPLYGYLLEEGDRLEAGDMYDSTAGDWQPCPCPGLLLGAGNAVTWVRPTGDAS